MPERVSRARVLLKSDEGWTDAAIAEVLDILEQTVRNIRQRYRLGRRRGGADRQAARAPQPRAGRWAGSPSHRDVL